MKDCTHCKHAEWKRRDGGNLHPSGDGRCKYPYKVPPVPACMYWPAGAPPLPTAFPINRRKELPNHCTYYIRAE